MAPDPRAAAAERQQGLGARAGAADQDAQDAARDRQEPPDGLAAQGRREDLALAGRDRRARNLGGSPIYGPWAFGTAAYSTLSDWPGGGVVGIHGTDQPGLLPGRVSHGCIRVPNWNIEKLKRLMPVGTPVWIHR